MAASDAKRATTHVAEAVPSDVRNSVFLGNAALDNVVSCLIAMSAEVWATKRRMKVMEALLAKNGVRSEDIEKYVPTDAMTPYKTSMKLEIYDADADPAETEEIAGTLVLDVD